MPEFRYFQSLPSSIVLCEEGRENRVRSEELTDAGGPGPLVYFVVLGFSYTFRYSASSETLIHWYMASITLYLFIFFDSKGGGGISVLLQYTNMIHNMHNYRVLRLPT